MNRFLTLLLSGVASSAMASVSINWISPANSILTDTSTAAPSTWIAQLIYSPDALVSPFDGANPFLPTEGEVVLRQGQLNINSINGRIVVGSVTGGAEYEGGFIYTRVFNVDFNGGSPSTPTLFGNSALVSGPLPAFSPTDPTTIINHSSTGLLVNVNQAVVIVPEPSTYAFFGLGALMVARRLRKLKA
jgi:hypothetical protein